MDRLEFENTADEQLARAKNAGRWMLVVAYVQGPELTVEETTCDFPIQDHGKVLQLVEQAFARKEVNSEPIQMGALPLAPHLQQQEGGESNASAD